MSADHYRVLGVNPSADANEILASYRQLAKKWHPDKSLGDPDATARFQRLNEAYSVLKDPVRRAEYDGHNQYQQPKAPSRRRPSRYAFHMFNAGSSWTDSFGATDSNEHILNPADAEVREARRRTHEDGDFIRKMQAKHAEAQRELDEMLNRLDNARYELHENKEAFRFHMAQYKPFISLEELRKLRATNGYLSQAEKRRADLMDTRQDLENELKYLEWQLAKKRDFLRTTNNRIEERIRIKAENEKKLKDLGRAWRASEFHEGEEALESSNWSGWNGWCGWNNQETELALEEEKERQREKEKDRPWWVDEDVGTQEEAGKAFPKKEDNTWTDNLQAHRATRTWADGWVEAEKEEEDLEDKNGAGQEKRKEGMGGEDAGGRKEAGSDGTEGSVGSDSDADLLDLDDHSVTSKDLDQDRDSDNALDNAWWPEAHKIEEATRVWERCENEWRQASCQEW